MNGNDCFVYETRLMPMRKAMAHLKAMAEPCVGRETIRLDIACGRILAEPLIGTRDVPAFDNVAVDGWAFAMPRDHSAAPLTFEIQEGRAAAGHPYDARVQANHALRVLTGAKMPAGTDTVALQEQSEIVESRIRVPAGLRPGANRRRRGENIAAGTEVLGVGHVLRPQDVGVAAELGLAHLPVFRKIRVAILSCGDEVHEPGRALTQGGTYDANRPMLKALLDRLPVQVTDLGILSDNPSHIRNVLLEAGASHDLILASGGASQGDEDHVVRAVADHGRLEFWRVALKPGRPLGFGKLDDAMFVGLPGNPVAAMVCTLLFARPLILRLAGAPWLEPRRVRVPSGFMMRKQAGRSEYVRGRIEGGRVYRIAKQGSGILTSLVEADGLIELEDHVTSVHPGDTLPFLSFDTFGI